MTAALTHTATADPPPAGDALPGGGAPGSRRRPTAETARLHAADWNAFLAWRKGRRSRRAAPPHRPTRLVGMARRLAGLAWPGMVDNSRLRSDLVIAF